MKKEQDYEIKFWKDWLESDGLKRLKLVEKLPLLDKNLKMKSKLVRHSFVGLLNSYFEDLESAIYIKMHKEKKQKA